MFFPLGTSPFAITQRGTLVDVFRHFIAVFIYFPDSLRRNLRHEDDSDDNGNDRVRKIWLLKLCLVIFTLLGPKINNWFNG